MNQNIARTAVEEARTLAGTGGKPDEIKDALDLALMAIKGETITDEDLDRLHPQTAHRLRDQGEPRA